MSDSLSLYEKKPREQSVTIVSIPSELGSDARGLSAAPNYLLEHGLKRVLQSSGAAVRVLDIACPEPKLTVGTDAMKNIEAAVDVSHRACAAVAQALAAGERVVALGGDHSISLGTIAGAAAQGECGVVWIDAHPDCNTPETTRSGNLHGMPAAVRMGAGDVRLTKIGGTVAPEYVVYIGLKDMDQAEIDFIRERHIPAVTMHDIAASNLAPAFAAIGALTQKVGRVWVSMDMDAIDDEYAPGVAMRNDGGLTRREALALARYVGRTCEVVGLDLVETVPGRDKEGKTAALAVELAALFLGMESGAYARYMQNYEEAAALGARKSSKTKTPR